MRKYSFSQRVINEWNKLSNDCVNASANVNARLDPTVNKTTPTLFW